MKSNVCILLVTYAFGGICKNIQSLTLRSHSSLLWSSEFCLTFANVLSITQIFSKSPCLKLQIPRAVANSEKLVHAVKLIKALVAIMTQ